MKVYLFKSVKKKYFDKIDKTLVVCSRECEKELGNILKDGGGWHNLRFSIWKKYNSGTFEDYLEERHRFFLYNHYSFSTYEEYEAGIIKFVEELKALNIKVFIIESLNEKEEKWNAVYAKEFVDKLDNASLNDDLFGAWESFKQNYPKVTNIYEYGQAVKVIHENDLETILGIQEETFFNGGYIFVLGHDSKREFETIQEFFVLITPKGINRDYELEYEYTPLTNEKERMSVYLKEFSKKLFRLLEVPGRCNNYNYIGCDYNGLST